MDKIADLIIRFRIPLLALIIAVTAGFLWHLPDLEFDFSVESMMLEGDPDVQLVRDTFDRFGSDQISFLAIRMPTGSHAFTRKNLEILQGLHDKIEAIEEVGEVTSLFSLKLVEKTVDGFDINPLVDGLPTSTVAEEKLKHRALAEEAVIGAMFSETADTVLVMIRYDCAPEDFQGRVRAVKRVRSMLESILPPTMEWHLAGLPTGAQIMNDLGIRNACIFLPITILVISIFLLIIFRSSNGLVLPQMISILGAVWTVGLMVMLGRKFNMATTMIPSLITAYSFSDIIHLLTHYYHEISAGAPKRVALRRMVKKLIVPCFLSSLTTSIGFSSLVVSDLRPIRVFGIFASTGVMIVFLLAMILTPILLYYTSVPAGPFLRQHTRGRTFHLMEAISRLVRRRPVSVLLVFGMLLVGGIVGISILKVETNIIEFFKDDNEIIHAKDFIQRHLTGTTPIDVVIIKPERGSFKQPEELKRLDETARAFAKLPFVRKVTTLADWVKEINDVMTDQGAAIPDDRRLVAQYLLVLSSASDELSRLMDAGYRTARIMVRADYMKSAEMKELIAGMNRQLSENYQEPDVARVTGTASLFVKMVDYLIKSQAKSLCLAFLLILIVMTVLFRSFKIGLLSMIPNIFPIVMVLGIMGLLGIDLDIVTAMVASVSLGIAVDDTIHFLVRFLDEFKHNDDPRQVLAATLTTTGKAMSFTTLTICCGFGVLMLSLINPPAYFGLLICISMAFALFSDLFIMPAIMVLLHPEMRLRKGEEEEFAVPKV